MKFSGILLLAALLPATASAALLAVREVQQGARLQRGSEGVMLKPGDALASGDVVRVDEEGRLTAGLARYGTLDLGAGSELAVERLPFAAYAPDLHSLLQLQRGYLRILWNWPGRAHGWPLQVQLGTYRLSLENGEYFFESTEGVHLACIGAGQALLSSAAAALPTTLRRGACYRLDRASIPPGEAIDEASLVSARRGYSLDGVVLGSLAQRPSLAPASLPAAESPGQPAPAPPVMRLASAAVVPGAAARAPAASPLQTGPWILTLASFADPDDAEAERQRLLAAGHRALVEPTPLKGGIWYRVRIRGFAEAETAQALGQALGEQFGFRNPWVSR